MEKQDIALTMGHIITVISVLASVIVALAGCIVYVYAKGEDKNKQIIDLTKSFTESTKDHSRVLENNTKALENNTRVIGELPECFILQLRAHANDNR